MGKNSNQVLCKKHLKLSNQKEAANGASKQKKSKKSSRKENANEKEAKKNIPAEELLELGLNYLHQAIKSWETALDTIESSAYMQSQTLALPVIIISLIKLFFKS